MRERGKLRNPWIIKKERKKVQLKGITPCPTEHRREHRQPKGADTNVMHRERKRKGTD